MMLLISGCSISRVGRIKNCIPEKEITGGMLTEVLQEQNLTSSSFFIQKAEIEIVGPEGTEKLIANVKFKKPDEYLISIRNKTGIEAARIFINADTILLNDRINKKLYCASPKYLKKKYGLTTSVLPLIFGDYIGSNLFGNSINKCTNGELNINTIVDGVKIKYLIDCNKAKSITAISESNLNAGGIEIRCNRFFKEKERFIPGKVEIRDFQSETIIILIIKKMSSSWDGTIEFIPGNRYEIIQLL